MKLSASRILSILIFFLFFMFYSLDSISITAPPWDYCGFTHNHIGTSFTCIQFDVEPWILK